jgi:hypothetical protein
MTRIPLPSARIPVVGADGLVTTPWYSFFAQWLQTLSDDVSGGAVDLTALTARVATAETDVDTLQAADVLLQAADTALQGADRELFIDDAMTPDRLSEIVALAARVTALELTLDMMTDRGAEIDVLRKRIRDLEADISMRGF